MKSVRFAVQTAAAAIVGLSLCAGAYAEQPANTLMGWTEGAEVLEPIPETQGRIDTFSGVIFSQVKSVRAMRQLRMTLLVPRNTAKKPAVIYFPGGGFTSADHEKMIEMRYALARAGFVVAAAEYRVVPSVYPAMIDDARAAIRYVREHAEEFGVDPARIGVIGDSAGGYVVEMLGTTKGEPESKAANADVQAVVSMYGISDLMTIGEGLGKDIEAIHHSPSVTEALILNGPAFNTRPGKTIDDMVDQARAASPIAHVDGSEPPMLLMHGAADKLVSPKQSQKLFEALKAKGADVRYVLVRDAEHGTLPWYQEPVIERIKAFFIEKLGKPAAAGEGKTENL